MLRLVRAAGVFCLLVCARQVVAADTPVSGATAFMVGRADLARSASFTVIRTLSPAGGTPIVNTYHVTVDGANGRVDYDDPAMGPVRYLTTAQGAFLYIPGNQSATRYSLKGGIDLALRQAFQFVTSQGRAFVRTGTATVSGQPTITYRNPSNGAVVFIGTRPGFRLPVKGVLRNEGGSQSFVVSDIRLNISTAKALFAIPAGTQIIRDGGDSAGPGATSETR
jgi:hypothetical protein